MISDDDQQYTYLPSRPALSQLDQLLTIGSALNLSTLDCSTTHNNIHVGFTENNCAPPSKAGPVCRKIYFWDSQRNLPQPISCLRIRLGNSFNFLNMRRVINSYSIRFSCDRSVFGREHKFLTARFFKYIVNVQIIFVLFTILTNIYIYV